MRRLCRAVTQRKDFPPVQASDCVARGGVVMDTGVSSRSDWGERIVGGTLMIMLLAGIAWALAGGAI